MSNAKETAKSGAGSAPRSMVSALYEVFIIALTVLSLVVMVLYFLVPVHSPTRQALARVDLMMCIVFLFDSFVCLYRADDRKQYMKWGWLDFLGSIPIFIPLRLARLARLGRAIHVLRTRPLRDVIYEARRKRGESSLLSVLFVAILVLSFASVLVLEFEHDQANANILTADEAVWWAVVTAATVGYGDYFPVSQPGRVTAMVLMVVGVGLFGVVTSYLASVFVRSDSEEAADQYSLADDLARMQEQLNATQSELAEIKALLVDSRSSDLPTL